MSSVIPRPEGPNEKRIPLVSETHMLKVTGQQVSAGGASLEPIDQTLDTADRLRDGGVVTAGRHGGGAHILCGGNDKHVSRQMLSASVHGRKLSINALGGNEAQVLVFKNGQLDEKETATIAKAKTGSPDAGKTDGCTVTIGGENVSVVIAMGTKIEDDRSIMQSVGFDKASRMVFGAEEGASIIEMVGNVQDMRVRKAIDDSLTHSNFIRLDFQANEGAQVPAVEEPPVAALDETHNVSMTYILVLNPKERVVERDIAAALGQKPVNEKITGRLSNGGNVMMGCAENAASAVEVQMGAHGEVATRQVLVRVEQSQGKNFAVVEKLSPDYPTEIFREDDQGNISPVSAPGDIARIEIPSNKEVTVKIGLGLAPHLQLPVDGMSMPSVSAAGPDEASSAELPDLAVEMSKFRFELKFTPRNMVTHEQPRDA